MKTLRLLVVVFMLMVLTGCVAFKEVCAEENEELRKALIKEIQKSKPWYPDDGACGVEQKIRKITDRIA